MKVHADKRHSERHFEVGDWVYVKLHPYRQRSLLTKNYSKLAHLYYGPFQIQKRIGQAAYKLSLHSTCDVHPTFHVSKLKRQLGRGAMVQKVLPQDLDVTTAVPIAILDTKMVQRGNRAAKQVLIQWNNGTKDEATWEFYYDMQKCFPDLPLENLN